MHPVCCVLDDDELDEDDEDELELEDELALLQFVTSVLNVLVLFDGLLSMMWAWSPAFLPGQGIDRSMTCAVAIFVS